jgi:hypothetical protein
MKKKKIVIWSIVLVALIALMAVIYSLCRPKASVGSKQITVEVVDQEGSSKSYTAKTDAEYLVNVMDELSASTDFTYEGSSSTYGLYIDTINGEKADYTKDGAYWAIYINGNYGEYTADQQPVNDGDAFRLVYEK